MRKCLIALFTLFPAALMAATVWTWVDDQGRRHYSDRQVPGATAIEIAGSQPSASPAPRPPQGGQSPDQDLDQGQSPAPPPEAVTYTVLDIISPAEQETYWNIGSNLMVELATYPALAVTDRINAILDGESIALGARTLQVTVPNVFRGQHTLQMVIVDSDGAELLRSARVTFFVQQTSILN